MNVTTISHVRQWKKQQRKFASITVYDASFARIFAQQGISVMLVGDSLSMTIQGHDSTIPVTLDDMVYHIRCVRRGAPNCLLLADMPFMSYSTSCQAFDSASCLMRAGANMVKLEGGHWLEDIVNGLTQRSVPVCCHLGLTPQSINIFGGYKIQGRDNNSAEKLLTDAITLEKAGAQMLVLECVPINLAERVTKSLEIPVIGIGAGASTDGQILVMQDVIGITGDNAPSFTKDFLTESRNIPAAIRLYIQEVETGRFPTVEHSFG